MYACPWTLKTEVFFEARALPWVACTCTVPLLDSITWLVLSSSRDTFAAPHFQPGTRKGTWVAISNQQQHHLSTAGRWQAQRLPLALAALPADTLMPLTQALTNGLAGLGMAMQPQPE